MKIKLTSTYSKGKLSLVILTLKAPITTAADDKIL